MNIWDTTFVPEPSVLPSGLDTQSSDLISFWVECRSFHLFSPGLPWAAVANWRQSLLSVRRTRASVRILHLSARRIECLILFNGPSWKTSGFQEHLDRSRVEKERRLPYASSTPTAPAWRLRFGSLMCCVALLRQLDSHMRFVKDWDLKAREQLLHCRSRCLKPVLCSASVSNWKGGRESRYSSCSAEFELTTPD